MKKLLLVFLFFVSLSTAKAQDKIITIKHDTIQCRIVSVNGERITYEQKTSDNQLVGNSIATSEVFQYYRSAKSDNLNKSFVYEKAKRVSPAHRWLFSLQGGLAHSFADNDNSKNILILWGNPETLVDDYYGKLENGYHLNTSMHYLVNSFLGLGLDYNLFYASSKAEFWSQGYGSPSVPVYMKIGVDERVYSHFAGVSVLFQQLAGKIKISETITPGIVMLRDENRDYHFQGYGGYGYGSSPYYDQANNLSTGTTFGAKGSLSVEYALTPQLSAGLAGNYLWAELHKLSVKTSFSNQKDQKLVSPIILSHIDYGFIVRYNF